MDFHLQTLDFRSDFSIYFKHYKYLPNPDAKLQRKGKFDDRK